MKLPFEDLHDKYSAPGYATTNEEVDLFNDMLKRTRFRKVATIASGGEVPFFILAPRSTEVIAVDHSYRSIMVCMIKAHLLETLGGRACRKLFVEGGYDKVFDTWRAVAETLDVPENAKKCVVLDRVNYRYRFDSTSQLRQQLLLTSDDYRDLRKNWRYTEVETVVRCVKHLHKIKLVHGDLKDIVDRGPFDAFYASNATGHAGRSRTCPTFKDFSKLLVGGGTLLSTTGSTFPAQQDGGLSLQKSLPGYITHWKHCLYSKATIGGVL